jgi:hypothetical protein
MARSAWWQEAKCLLVMGVLVVGCGREASLEAPRAGTPPGTESQEGKPPEPATPGWGPASNVLPELGWSSREATPAGRWGVAAVVDSAADRLIVLGSGHDVWSLPLSGPNELQWLRLRPQGDLPPATPTVAVYDHVGNRALMLFDDSAGDDIAQLWELSLDGTARFSRLTPSGKAPGRELAGAQLAIDVQGDRLFALGGTLGQFGAWTLSLEPGAAWQRLADAPPDPGGPSFLRGYAGALLAFDTPRQRLVAFGLHEVWALPLETGQWSSLGRDPCASRFLSPAVFDPLAQRVTFVGGECGGIWTFALAKDSWEQTTAGDPLAVLASPSAGAFDAARDRVVFAFAQTSNATWQMSSSSLELKTLTPNTHVSLPADGSRAVWDPLRQAVVSFGGEDERQTLLRKLEPTATWQRLSPETGLRGYHPGAIYDPTTSAIVAFGSTEIEADDVTVRTLASQASAWSALDVAPGPMGRAKHVSVYDSARRRMVIHGGVHNPLYTDSSVVLDDTWALSLEDEHVWTQLTPRGPAPRPREFFRMGAYDVAGERMVVCSVDEASGAIPDVHALSLDDDPTWSLLEPSGNPPERIRGDAVVYDPLGQRLIFTDGSVVSALELGDAPAWHEFCPLGTPPAHSYSPPQVVVVPDGLFVDVAGEAFRFDLATPYCD